MKPIFYIGNDNNGPYVVYDARGNKPHLLRSVIKDVPFPGTNPEVKVTFYYSELERGAVQRLSRFGMTDGTRIDLNIVTIWVAAVAEYLDAEFKPYHHNPYFHLERDAYIILYDYGRQVLCGWNDNFIFRQVNDVQRSMVSKFATKSGAASILNSICANGRIRPENCSVVAVREILTTLPKQITNQAFAPMAECAQIPRNPERQSAIVYMPFDDMFKCSDKSALAEYLGIKMGVSRDISYDLQGSDHDGLFFLVEGGA